MMDSTFPIKKHSWHGLDIAETLPRLLWACRTKRLPLGQLGLHLGSYDSSSVMTFFRKSGSLVVVWIKSLAPAAQCSFCCGIRSHGTNFVMTHFMPRSCIKTSDTVVFGIPRSASSSHTVSCWSLLIAACRRSTFSGVLLVAGLAGWGSFNRFSTSLKYLYHTFICAALLHHPQKLSESSK